MTELSLVLAGAGLFVAAALGFGLVWARSNLAASLAMTGAALAAALAATALGAGAAGLTLAVGIGALGGLWTLAAGVFQARQARPRPPRAWVGAALGAVAAGALLLWAGADVPSRPAGAVFGQSVAARAAAETGLSAPPAAVALAYRAFDQVAVVGLFLVLGLAALGLLGFGERAGPAPRQPPPTSPPRREQG